MFQILKTVFQRQAFSPGVFGVLINPFYFARHGLSTAIHDLSPSLSGKLLDVGCGTKPYQDFFDVSEYVGLDIEREGSQERSCADYLYNGDEFPFQDDKFNSVLCNQVLEHVFNPANFLSEIYRVMKPEGKLLLTVPFVWDEHEQPFDYARYSTYGLKALLEASGFEVIEHKKLGADVTVIFQLINAYIYKVSRPLPWLLRVPLIIPVFAVVNIFGVLCKCLLPSNPDLFLDHIVLAEKRK